MKIKKIDEPKLFLLLAFRTSEGTPGIYIECSFSTSGFNTTYKNVQ
jgi:hypothetical protein